MQTVCTTTYSRHSVGFFANSVLRRMLPARCAAPPLRLHPLNEKPRNTYLQHRSPPDNHRRERPPLTRSDTTARRSPASSLRLSPGERATISCCAEPRSMGPGRPRPRAAVALAPEVMALPIQVLPRCLALLFPQLPLLLLDPASLEIAKTRIVSRLIRVGADMRTRPVGGYTLRWTFLMFLNVTSTDPAQSSRSAISIRPAP